MNTESGQRAAEPKDGASVKQREVSAGRTVALVVPLILVNGFAVTGQLGWAREHLVPAGTDGRAAWVIATLFAAALESIALFLQAEAHAALLAGDAAWKLSLSARGVALLVGALNYAHYAPSLTAPTVPAVTFAGMSVVSPWLWSVRSRSARRAELRASGLVDERTARFSTLRWLLHFRRTWHVWRTAVWAGEADPARALARFAGDEVWGTPRVTGDAPQLPEDAAELDQAPVVEVVSVAQEPAQPAPELPAPPIPAEPPAPAEPRAGRLTIEIDQAAILARQCAPFPAGWYRPLQTRYGGSDTWWKQNVRKKAEALLAEAEAAPPAVPLRAVGG